jgi:hypothetical protein
MEGTVFDRTRALAIAALAACLGMGVATASPVQVSIDTSALAGTSATLAFDFVEGGPPSNSVTITGFSSDGTLGSATLTGDVTGTLPGTVTLGDAQFFNELLQDIVLGSTIAFTFDATGNPPDDGSLPDAFSFFILDPKTLMSLIETTDLTGAGSLLLFSIGSSSPLEVYGSPQVTITAVSTVPEPSSALLVLIAMAAGAALRSRSWRRRAVRAR